MSKQSKAFVTWIDIAAIDADPSSNARRAPPAPEADLVASVRESGIQVPLHVVPTGDSERYRLIAGFRRLAAASAAGHVAVPCIILPRATTRPPDEARINLLENLFRADMCPCDLSRGLAEWRDRHPAEQRPTGADAARVFGLDARYVGNLLRCRDKGSKDLMRHWDQYPHVPMRHFLKVLTLTKAEQLPALLRALAPREKSEKSEKMTPDTPWPSAVVELSEARDLLTDALRVAQARIRGPAAAAGFALACSVVWSTLMLGALPTELASPGGADGGGSPA